MFDSKRYSGVSRHKILIGVLCLLTLCVWARHTPDDPPIVVKKTPIKTAVDDPQKVYLEYANELQFDKDIHPDFQILRGDVRFRRGGMHMFCDSAYFYEKTNSQDAFGNVRMEQGDTLFVYSDVMFYDGIVQVARLRYNVRMENRDVVLFTDSLNYDMQPNIGYYFDGGKIVDTENELSSIYGQYSPDTKQAVFNFDVQLVNEEYTLYSDTLEYNTNTKIADIIGPSVMVSDSNVIYSKLGWYDTHNNTSMLFDRSIIVSKSQQLTGDTIFYNRAEGFGEVFGNMILNDTTRRITMEGNYGFYDEIKEASMATDSARVIDYSQPDTFYLHADTLRSSVLLDSTRLIRAYYGTRFFRNDIQGICDSMVYKTKDSAVYMFKNPILWNLDYQIFGDTIKVYMNDSTVRWAHVPAFAFATQQKDTAFFDQLSGKDLKAFFKEGRLDQVDVSGNVRTIFYPQERDSTFTGLNYAESSFLTMYLKDQKMVKLIMWPKVEGSLTPIPKITPAQLYLPDFHWYEEIRPRDPADIFRKIIRKKSEIPKKKRRFSNEI